MERVRITHPRTVPSRRRPRTVRSEIDAQTELGEVYMRSLLRSQLRLGLGVLGFVAVTIAGLPLLFTLVPDLRDLVVLGMPLPWVLLAFAVYPTLVALGWFYVRRAERHEQDFVDVVGSDR